MKCFKYKINVILKFLLYFYMSAYDTTWNLSNCNINLYTIKGGLYQLWMSVRGQSWPQYFFISTCFYDVLYIAKMWTLTNHTSSQYHWLSSYYIKFNVHHQKDTNHPNIQWQCYHRNCTKWQKSRLTTHNVLSMIDFIL